MSARALALLAALALACCGGGRGGSVGVIEVHAHAFGDGWTFGQTTPTPDGAVVLVEPRGWPHDLRSVVHELLHAVGLADHEAGDLCYLRLSPLVGYGGEPLCEAEAARLRSVDGTWEVRVYDDALVEPVARAVAVLNAAAGRAVLR